jgi:hypothetical protein
MARLTGRFTPQKRCDLFLNNQVEQNPKPKTQNPKPKTQNPKPKGRTLKGF